MIVTQTQLEQLLMGGVGALLLSTAARALPEPLPEGSRFYLFIYRFAQGLMANWDRTGKP